MPSLRETQLQFAAALAAPSPIDVGPPGDAALIAVYRANVRTNYRNALAASYPVVKRLTTLPGIGPITASAFVAALDIPGRFDGAAQVTSYLGLVPREHSSGQTQRRGHVLRSAHPQVQCLLVQAALRVSRSSDPRTAQLRSWAQTIARRRGKKIATVALARRIARTLFAMWRDETVYEPQRVRVRQVTGASERTSGVVSAASV